MGRTLNKTSYRWPAGLWDRAKAMLDVGKSVEDVSVHIGVELQVLKNKIRWENMSADEIERRRIRMRENRRYQRRQGKGLREWDRAPRLQMERPSAIRPAPGVVEERDYRLSLAPRDLTAAFCGDPLPGYSALDRREARP